MDLHLLEGIQLLRGRAGIGTRIYCYQARAVKYSAVLHKVQQRPS